MLDGISHQSPDCSFKVTLIAYGCLSLCAGRLFTYFYISGSSLHAVRVEAVTASHFSLVLAGWPVLSRVSPTSLFPNMKTTSQSRQIMY